MAKKATKLATTDAAELAEIAALAELSDFFDSTDTDGMEDVGGEDIKIGSKIWNMGGVDKVTKESYPKNVFFDTLTEKTTKTIDAILLNTTKTLRWDEFDNALDKTIVHCASTDRKTGTMSDGTVRSCEGCPDSGWFRDEDGKNFRKCGEIHTVVAIDLETEKPFVVRFKKTGLAPFRNYLMANHFGARVGKNGRKNIPLFAYKCHLSLVNHDSGKYALPVLTRGDVLPREQMEQAYSAAKQYKDMMADVMKVADKGDSRSASESTADNMSADDFVDE